MVLNSVMGASGLTPCLSFRVMKNGSSDFVVHKKLSLYLYSISKSSLRLDTF
jgi:hypothetical protein